MIVKSMSRKGSSSTGNIVRYIFKGQKENVLDSVRTPQRMWLPEFKGSAFKLTEKDFEHERAESFIAQLNYLFNKLSPEKDIPDFVRTYLIGNMPANCFTHNIRSNSLTGAIQELNELEDRRIRKTENMVNVYHDVVSFTPDDSKKLTDQQLKSIANKYFELRGTNTAAIATVHKDKDHTHLHFVISGTCIDGKANRISKEDFQRVKEEIQEYQKEMFPELKSTVEHGKKARAKIADRETVKNIKIADERNNHKVILLEVAERALSRSGSVAEFVKDIEAAGHTVYYRNERLQGIKYEGNEKFRFSNLGIAVSDIQQLDTIQNQQLNDLEEIQRIKAAVREREQQNKLDDFERMYSESQVASDNSGSGSQQEQSNEAEETSDIEEDSKMEDDQIDFGEDQEIVD